MTRQKTLSRIASTTSCATGRVCTRLFATLGFALIAASLPARAADNTRDDLMSLPLEDLLNVEVFGASKYAQRTNEAPAAVTIISAADIRDYGYRTLADILKSVRSLHITNDHNYGYVGVRGFSTPGDFNSRVLFLINGYRIHDNVYDQAMIGNEFVLDVDLIDRVEFIPGPGSSIYGSNALFGVVNIITQSGEMMNGFRTAVEGGSNTTRQVRASYGSKMANGADFLFSASRGKTNGQDFFFPEFNTPATNNGLAKGLDGDNYARLFAKLGYESWSFSAGYVNREKDLPTAPYASLFGASGSRTIDRTAFVDTRYEKNTHAGALLGRLYVGNYAYDATYVHDAQGISANRDFGGGSWWGSELRLLNSSVKNHKLVAGLEYENNVRQYQENYEQSPFTLYLNEKYSSKKSAAYVQDEVRLRDNLIIGAGLRYDHHSVFGGITNPRISVIYLPQPDTSVKLLYGSAYRIPSLYEQFYQDGISQTANPDLKPEKIKTYELAFEKNFTGQAKLTTSLFRYKVKELITLRDPGNGGLDFFDNLLSSEAQGAEFEIDKAWANGARGRISYTHQRARDAATGRSLQNSPEDLAKLNFTTPLWRDSVRLGFESQYVGTRQTKSASVPSHHVENLSFQGRNVLKGLDLTAGINNLFNADYADPAGPEHVMDAIPQDKRSYRIKAEYKF